MQKLLQLMRSLPPTCDSSRFFRWRLEVRPRFGPIGRGRSIEVVFSEVIGEILLHQSSSISDVLIAIFNNVLTFFNHVGLSGFFFENELDTFVNDFGGIIGEISIEDFLELVDGILKRIDLLFEQI